MRRASQSKHMDIFNLYVKTLEFLKLKEASQLWLSRDMHVNSSPPTPPLASCWVPPTKDLCVAHNVEAGGRMWWCVRDRCFGGLTHGKQEVIPLMEGSHMAYGSHWRETEHQSPCVSFVVEKTYRVCLSEVQKMVGVIHTHWQLSQTLYYCECFDRSVTPSTRIRALFLDRGSVFEAPFPSTLWSIHPVMNEEAVKEGKAGVGLCVCVCALSLSEKKTHGSGEYPARA